MRPQRCTAVGRSSLTAGGARTWRSPVRCSAAFRRTRRRPRSSRVWWRARRGCRMSRRVYEIARELDLDTKEVIGRLNEAGVEVKHHSASVEDPVYERVFGDGTEAQNGRSEAQEAEAAEARAEAERSGHGASVAAGP